MLKGSKKIHQTKFHYVKVYSIYAVTVVNSFLLPHSGIPAENTLIQSEIYRLKAKISVMEKGTKNSESDKFLFKLHDL